MRTFTWIFVAMAFLAFPNFSFGASVSLLPNSVIVTEDGFGANEPNEDFYQTCNGGCDEVDQVQLDTDRVEELKNFKLSDGMGAEEVYRKILESLHEMKELAERLGLNEKVVLLSISETPKNLMEDLEALLKSKRTIKAELTTYYLTADSQCKYTQEEVYSMSNWEWNALVSLYKLSNDRNDFLRTAKKANFLSFSLAE